jgi:hypothetical protein
MVPVRAAAQKKHRGVDVTVQSSGKIIFAFLRRHYPDQV